MAVKSGVKTYALIWFRAALEKWLKDSGKNKTEAAALLDMTQGNLSNIMTGKRSISLAAMEEIAEKLDKHLIFMLAEGKTYITGRPFIITEEDLLGHPQIDDKTSVDAATTAAQDIELRLLRQIADMAAKQTKMSDKNPAEKDQINETKKSYTYTTMFYTIEMIDDDQLSSMLESGWEMVAMAPSRMMPDGGSTIVKEYLVTLRQPVGND